MSKFYEYDLPKERIAQFPAAAAKGERSRSRLLHAKRSERGAAISDNHVSDLPGILRPNDLLVLNNSRVKPCRFFLQLDGKQGELLLVSQLSSPEESSVRYRALARPMRSFKVGERYQISPSLTVIPLGRNEESFLEVELVGEGNLDEAIAREALMPIPPYIRGGHAGHIDREYYQTVYATEPGSIAAPTAGLHFTDELLQQLVSGGVRYSFVTLHVGTASFRPAEQQDPNLVVMDRELFKVPAETQTLIEETKRSGGRIVAVGTTSVRALESFYLDRERFPDVVKEEAGGYFSSSILIRPGHEWKVVDVLFTNFHQPGSTHMLLVGAFLGADEVEKVYKHGLESGYRFLSYGDAMLLE